MSSWGATWKKYSRHDFWSCWCWRHEAVGTMCPESKRSSWTLSSQCVQICGFGSMGLACKRFPAKFFLLWEARFKTWEYWENYTIIYSIITIHRGILRAFPMCVAMLATQGSLFLAHFGCRRTRPESTLICNERSILKYVESLCRIQPKLTNKTRTALTGKKWAIRFIPFFASSRMRGSWIFGSLKHFALSADVSNLNLLQLNSHDIYMSRLVQSIAQYIYICVCVRENINRYFPGKPGAGVSKLKRLWPIERSKDWAYRMRASLLSIAATSSLDLSIWWHVFWILNLSHFIWSHRIAASLGNCSLHPIVTAVCVIPSHLNSSHVFSAFFHLISSHPISCPLSLSQGERKSGWTTGQTPTRGGGGGRKRLIQPTRRKPNPHVKDPNLT